MDRCRGARTARPRVGTRRASPAGNDRTCPDRPAGHLQDRPVPPAYDGDEPVQGRDGRRRPVGARPHAELWHRDRARHRRQLRADTSDRGPADLPQPYHGRLMARSRPGTVLAREAGGHAAAGGTPGGALGGAPGRGAALSIGLSAVIVAASIQEPRVLTIKPLGGKLPAGRSVDPALAGIEALPSGPLEAEHRTLE